MLIVQFESRTHLEVQVTSEEGCVMYVKDLNLVIELRKVKSDVHVIIYLC